MVAIARFEVMVGYALASTSLRPQRERAKTASTSTRTGVGLALTAPIPSVRSFMAIAAWSTNRRHRRAVSIISASSSNS